MSLYDHSHLFRQILNSSIIKNTWNSTILYFSETWINNIKHHAKWYDLKQFFYKLNARRALFPINATHYNTAYSLLLEKKNVKPNPYVFDTFKHLIQIMCGHSPGLAPLINDELLPLKDLQDIFKEFYGLGAVHPTIMGPSHFNPFLETCEPIYYSMQVPITHSFSPKSKKSSVMVELKELCDLSETLLHELRSDNGFCANTIIQYIAKNLATSYHHNSKDIDNLISSIHDLIQTDNRFKNDLLSVAENGKFFRGCIKIYKKSNVV